MVPAKSDGWSVEPSHMQPSTTTRSYWLIGIGDLEQAQPQGLPSCHIIRLRCAQKGGRFYIASAAPTAALLLLSFALVCLFFAHPHKPTRTNTVTLLCVAHYYHYYHKHVASLDSHWR